MHVKLSVTMKLLVRGSEVDEKSRRDRCDASVCNASLDRAIDASYNFEIIEKLANS